MANKPGFSNQLSSEKSPYLLQHANNPVNWLAWGDFAFQQAVELNKPILLSIGYSTCHWCHVMAHESFEDEIIAQYINSHFIPIKVDREERPDIDHIYMQAVLSMTGQGGWPLTVFLTPQAKPFYGGTYFPPKAKWGSVGFLDLLVSIATAWEKDSASILMSGQHITENITPKEQRLNDAEFVEESLIHKAYKQLLAQFDKYNGGFGEAPKFPMGHHLSFLLRYYRRSGQEEALTMVQSSLDAIERGGIWDHLGGGFHRYATDQSWHVPHFEKMLYDQAILSMAYLEAYQVTGLMNYAKTARSILDYVLEEMTDPLGGFYSALDADSPVNPGADSTEGAYYVWDYLEIEKILGKNNAAIFNYVYGVLPQGNVSHDPHGTFTEKNILFLAHTLEETSLKFNLPISDLEDILRESSVQLKIKRHERPAVHKDDKVLCSWNGLMIASFAFASRVLDEPRYAKAACDAVNFILKNMKKDGCLYHRWREGQAGIESVFEDYAYFIYGLIFVYEAVFDNEYLNEARYLTDQMISLFKDNEGGFFMTSCHSKELIFRPKEEYDGALPSGNSIAALVLLKLYALTEHKGYGELADDLFRSLASSVIRSPYGHTSLLTAYIYELEGALEIKIEGALKDPMIAKMIKVMYKYFVPFKVVSFMKSDLPAQIQLCYQGRCQKLIADAVDFEKEILTLIK